MQDKNAQISWPAEGGQNKAQPLWDNVRWVSGYFVGYYMYIPLNSWWGTSGRTSKTSREGSEFILTAKKGHATTRLESKKGVNFLEGSRQGFVEGSKKGSEKGLWNLAGGVFCEGFLEGVLRMEALEGHRRQKHAFRRARPLRVRPT